MESSIEIIVRSTEVDYLGHVNNAKYLEYMEWGREDWYSKTGYSFNRMGQEGIGTVTVNININYYQESVMGDVLILKTSPARVGKSSFVLLQELFNKGTGERVGGAEVTTVTIDLEKRKAVPVPEYLTKHMVT